VRPEPAAFAAEVVRFDDAGLVCESAAFYE
jgi:hypothetical protein